MRTRPWSRGLQDWMKPNRARMSATLLEELVFLKCNDCWVLTTTTECIVCSLDSSYYIEHFACVDFTKFLFLMVAQDMFGLSLTLRSHCVMVSLTSLSSTAINHQSTCRTYPQPPIMLMLMPMRSLRWHFTNKSVAGAPYSIKSYSLSHSWTVWQRVRRLKQWVPSWCRGGTAAAMAQNEQTTEEHSTLEQQSLGRLNHPAWCVVWTIIMLTSSKG